jgi:phosphatidylserine/phosphatidylglycerophosphate/cardiolipin synthase-like enzyme
MGKYLSTYFSPADRAGDHVIGFIDFLSPGDTLDVMVYSLTHDRIAEALIRAHNNGVKIRVLMDKVQAAGQYADDEKLVAAGIQLRRDTQAGLMHHKVAIENGAVVGLGSFNWTKSADERNAENWNVVRLKYVAADYQEEFNRLWELNAPPE